MNKPRSPIEMMVDRACGFDPNTPTKQPQEGASEEVVNALLEVADAAKAWSRNKKRNELRLKRAVKELVRQGW